MKHMDVKGVIARAKQALGVASDKALARHLQVPRGTVASWKRRGSIPAKHLSAMAAYNISLDWLLTGKGNPGDSGEFGVDEKGRETGQFTFDDEVLWVVLNIIERECVFSPDKHDNELAKLLNKNALTSLSMRLSRIYPRVAQSRERWLKSGIVKEEDVYVALLTEYSLIEWNSASVLPPWWEDSQII